jgi:serine/threonine protein kinase
LTDETLALEVGLNAAEYLEECFSNEASVLDRERFDDVPEITSSEFKITGILGKGSFCDVLEAVSNSIDTPAVAASPAQSFAIKCLRPQIRTNPEYFPVGADDLVHETAMLASLDHHHIIKLHGRAPDRFVDAFLSSSGYFIVLDKIHETLHERIGTWKQSDRTLEGPQAAQIEVARAVADAIWYLHSKNIVSRNIKPANVGFDSRGTIKLFDFGFAIGLPERNDTNPTGLLFDKCGSPRYMPPEMGLSLGYGLEADTYAFGILFWQMCSLEQPFSDIASVEAFERDVFIGGKRPTVVSSWPVAVKEIVSRCWSTEPSRRPSMLDVKTLLSSPMPSFSMK